MLASTNGTHLDGGHRSDSYTKGARRAVAPRLAPEREQSVSGSVVCLNVAEYRRRQMRSLNEPTALGCSEMSVRTEP